jgi:hypothetical protein
MKFIQDCSNHSEPLIAWPYLASFYYFTNRPVGSDLMKLAPGFFNNAQYQEQVVRDLEQKPVRYYVYKPQTFGSTASEIGDYDPIISDFLGRAYAPVRQYGTVTINVHRNWHNAPECTVK